MSVFHRVHSDARTIHVSYTGEVTSKSILTFFDQFEMCLHRFPNFCELVDLTAVERVSITSRDLMCLFSLIHGIYLRSSPDKSIAFVAHDQTVMPRAQGFVDYLAKQSRGPSACLFDNRSAAVMALEIPTDKRHLFHHH